MADYITMLQNISEAFLASTCLYDFLGRVESLLGIHFGVMNIDLSDPAQTEPLEPEAYLGEMKPCHELIVENIKRGYLSIPKETIVTDELRPILKLISDFVVKMPEITTSISTDSDAYIAGMYELLFSTNLERMASLRAQIGLSRFTEKGRTLNCFLINIAAFEAAELPSGLETQIREHLMNEGDVLLNHGKAYALFHIQQGKMLTEEYEESFETLLRSCKALACVSEPINDPTHDYRLRHHYNQNEQVLLYLRRSGYTGKRLVKYDDYRLVTMLYVALVSTNTMIFGQFRYVSNTVMNICQYDEQKGTEYFETLFAYLNSRFSLNETAQTLNIHRNTVVYRIRQLSERFGIDFDSPEECFQLNLSCRIYKMSRCFETVTE